MKTPQEIEVWYIIPAIRCELSKKLVKESSFSQKETAKLLDITQSAVSQYLKSKRATAIIFNNKIMDEISIASKRIKNKGDAMTEIQHLCTLIKKEKILCEVHRKHEQTGTCAICLQVKP